MTMRKRLLVSFAMIAVFSFSARADLVNVDFNVTGTNTMSGAAATGQSGDVWNGIVCCDNATSFSTFTTGALIDSASTATSLTLTIEASSGRYFGSITRSPVNMMYDYIGTAWPLKTVTINNVTPGTTYAIYLYGAGLNNEAQPSRFVIDGVAKTTTAATQTDGQLVEGQDYVIFNVTPTSNTIVIGYGYDEYNAKGAVFNGMQIETIPEPATLSLLALGCVVGLIRRRK